MRKKILKIAIIMLVSLVIGASIVNAKASSFNWQVEANKSKLKPGEEVTISLSVSDIDMGDNGMNVLEGVIKYDKDVFEEITNSNIKSESNWSTTYNAETSNSLNGKFLAVNFSQGVTKNTKIFSVTLKVKEKITKQKEREQEIVFEDITSNDGTNLVKNGSKTVKVNVDLGNAQENDVNTQTQKSGIQPIVVTAIVVGVCLLIGIIRMKNKKRK